MAKAPVRTIVPALFLYVEAKSGLSTSGNGQGTESAYAVCNYQGCVGIPYITVTYQTMQPSLGKFLPVTIHVGVWVFLWLWVGLTYSLILWLPFISWATWYAIGPTWELRKKRALKNVVGAFGGTIVAIVFIMLIPFFTSIFGDFAIPVLGFLAGMFIVLLELTDLFEWALGYFYAFASYFAFAFAGAAFGATESHVTNFMIFFGHLLVGFVLGAITDIVRVKILKAEGLFTEGEQQTIFDKERGM